jgi:hypothetical protein
MLNCGLPSGKPRLPTRASGAPFPTKPTARMTISSPASCPPRAPGAHVVRPASRIGVVAAFALLAGASGCSDSESSDPGEAGEAGEPTPCASNADCADNQVCQSAACVLSIPRDSRILDSRACSVMSCPASDLGCCSTAIVSATGNQNQAYSSQLQMLRDIGFDAGEVRAAFRFDAPNQQGWLTFQLGAELDLSRLEFTGWHDGVSDRFLSLITQQLDGGGCAFAFELEPRPAPPGSQIPFIFQGNVESRDDSFCYDGGRPGRASELAFAIFSTQPGPATLAISNITLTAE